MMHKTKDVIEIDTSAPKLKRGQYIIAKTYIEGNNYALLKVTCCKDVMINAIEKQYYIRTLYKDGKVYYKKFIFSTNGFTKKSFNKYFFDDDFGDDYKINLQKDYIVLPIETTLDEAILLLTIKNAEKKEGK